MCASYDSKNTQHEMVCCPSGTKLMRGSLDDLLNYNKMLVYLSVTDRENAVTDREKTVTDRQKTV